MSRKAHSTSFCDAARGVWLKQGAFNSLHTRHMSEVQIKGCNRRSKSAKAFYPGPFSLWCLVMSKRFQPWIFTLDRLESKHSRLNSFASTQRHLVELNGDSEKVHYISSFFFIFKFFNFYFYFNFFLNYFFILSWHLQSGSSWGVQFRILALWEWKDVILQVLGSKESV